MNRRMMDLWVGLFVAIGILAMVFMALRVANQSAVSNSSTYTVAAYFRNIGGLKVRSPVKSAGVTVGRVKSISLDTTTYQAKVEMLLDQTYPFSTDSSASINTSGLLGEQYINLETGAEEDVLKDGDTITLTSSALVLENLVGKFISGAAGSSSSE